jgi:hypothetical protein
MSDERRVLKRRRFTYYMRVLDNSTQQPVGYLANISEKGFQLDSPQQVAVNKDFSFRLDLTPDVSDKNFITFSARSRWCRPDESDPFSFNAGFQIVGISPHDNEIYQRIVTKYAAQDDTWQF